MRESGINQQSKISEVFIKRKTGHVFKHMSDYNIRDGVTERKRLISGKLFKNLFRRRSYGIVITNNIQRGLDGIEKFHGKFITCPVSEKRYSLADYIPCGIKRDFVFPERLKNFSCAVVIGIFRAKRGKEKGSITEGFVLRKAQ